MQIVFLFEVLKEKKKLTFLCMCLTYSAIFSVFQKSKVIQNYSDYFTYICGQMDYINHCENWCVICIQQITAFHSNLPKGKCSHFMSGTSVWRLRVSTVWGQTWILSLRSQWCPHSLANKRAHSGHPHNGVPPATGSEWGTSEQLAQRGAANQGRPLPLCCRGQHGKRHVWGGRPPHYRRY